MKDDQLTKPITRCQYSLIRRMRPGCLLLAFLFLSLLALLLIYFLAPMRTNILILGIDSRPGQGDLGRSDTNILITILPLKPYVGLLSIPRDLWINIPGRGQDRINTAHFYGEAQSPGEGPLAATQAVQENFGVHVDYYLRIRFDGFRAFVDALGGIDVSFSQSMSGYSPGVHHLDGEQALALVRDRMSSDDFFRMERGQLFIKSIWQQMLKPVTWQRIPSSISALSATIDTNIPLWLWPRLGVALLRVGPDGMDMRSITREMVNPFTTSGGAQVLGPRWEAINPLLLEMFGQ